MSDPTAPLPVITTLLLERRERGYLAWVAIANEVAELPLESPPIDASTHALEIHIEGFEEPLVVLADPMGAPSDQGFPLRLHPLDETQATTLRAELFAGKNNHVTPHQPKHKISHVTSPSSVGKRTETLPPSSLTEHHALALAKVTGPSSLSRRATGSLCGRSLGDGRFVLEDLLGGGASGEVYRAVHTVLRRPVAVKVLHPSLQLSQDYCTRFYAEALAASRLDHRNVLRVIDYGQEPDGLLYIVMELLEGMSLQEMLDTEGPLPETRLVDLIAQACAGLAHAHDAGVIHRDIKPENIVVVRGRDDDGRETELVKVCDFGIAHWTQPASSHEIGDDEHTIINMPDSGKVVGTPVYMSPEQIQNDAVDARTDVYALGIVLYELATGHLPFLSVNPLAILRAHMVEEPTPPHVHVPMISPGLEQIILKALEKEPDRRHQDARELRTELRHVIDESWASGSGVHRSLGRASTLTASAFINTPSDALRKLHGLDERDRPAAYTALAEGLKSSLIGGQLKLARDLVVWLRGRLTEHGLSDTESSLAQQAIRVLRDPEVVRAHAINVLDAKIERSEDALAILREAGPLAAHALIDVRRVRPPSLELRAHFVALLRAVGAPALSVIVSMLEPLAPLATRQDEAFAEDLLRALPDVRSDAAGDVTVRFVRLDKPAVGLIALRATTMLWGVRARPLLVGALDATHDGFRTLALVELQRLGCVDDLVIERLARILAGSAGHELKVAAATVLAAATPEARPRAVALVTARLAPAHGLMGSLRSALGQREAPHVAVALARSLRALDPSGSRILLDRLANARPELRLHLQAILAGR
ncbi:MAG: Serine/threonine protein kinase PrkC, regulator of stationary phase, partial [Labilithrix sp.]|nr:Serine/threonine protein kinase PrkC, regulator of stationary phase [Labilithrix sp.]